MPWPLVPIGRAMSATASCPTCQSELQRTAHGEFNSWVCPSGHGLAATLSETYEVAQEDELHRLWELTRAAKAAGTTGTRACPMCTRPMVAVTVPYDDDEADEGQPGDTPDQGEVPVDVCETDQVIWFDTAELDQLPKDLPDLEPTAQEQAALAKIRSDFGDQVMEAADGREDALDRLSDRILYSRRAFGPIARKIAKI